MDDRRRFLRRLAMASSMPLLAGSGSALRAQPSEPIVRTGGPYVPTPWPVVDQMLRAAAIGSSDLVMDLGCGDGRLVIAAAQRHGSRGRGVDIDPDLVRLANDTAAREGVGHLVRFEQRDIFETNVREATVLTLYLLPGMMLSLRDRLLAELQPGARIVAHDYHFGDWRADSQFTFDVPEKAAITGMPTTTIYQWTVPARLFGRWRVSAPAVAAFDGAQLVLRQTYQDLAGTLAPTGGRPALRIDAASMRGVQLRFGVALDARTGRPGRAVFRGRVDGANIEGMIESASAGDMRFVASRSA
jgi:SAM-dependent methyltransferase